MKTLKNDTEGHCPKCFAELSYNGSEVQDSQMFFEVHCDQCEYDGKEWFGLVYSETIENKKLEESSK